MVLLQIKSEESYWKIGVPILVAVFVFVANIFYQIISKRVNTRERLGNEIISTCDKMLRTYYNCEQFTLLARYYSARLRFEKDPKEHDITKDYHLYYWKEASSTFKEYANQKGDLIKTAREFNYYWNDETNKDLILSVIENILYVNPNHYNKEFKEGKTLEELEKIYNKHQGSLAEESYIKKLGFHLIYLQRLVDPKFPIKYTREQDQLDMLLERLKNYRKYAEEQSKPKEK